MLIESFAIVAAALFTGAAVYIAVAEQPARLALADAAMLAQWQASYRRAAPMQAGLALVGGLVGLAAFFDGGDLLWGAGALALLSAWPFTLLVIRPVNTALHATAPEAAGPETRRLVQRWGRLHAVRAGIGATATLIYLAASS